MSTLTMLLIAGFCILFWPNILGAAIVAGGMLAAAAIGCGVLIASPFVFVANKLQARKTQKALQSRQDARRVANWEGRDGTTGN